MTCILTPVVRYLALQKGFVDCPQRARKVHQQATPRLGGAAVLLSFLVIIAIAGITVPQLSELLWGNEPVIGSIILGSLGIFVIGFLDDLARLAAKTKLFGEFLDCWVGSLGSQFIFHFRSIFRTRVPNFSTMVWFWTFLFVDCGNGKCDQLNRWIRRACFRYFFIWSFGSLGCWLFSRYFFRYLDVNFAHWMSIGLSRLQQPPCIYLSGRLWQSYTWIFSWLFNSSCQFSRGWDTRWHLSRSGFCDSDS